MFDQLVYDREGQSSFVSVDEETLEHVRNQLERKRQRRGEGDGSGFAENSEAMIAKRFGTRTEDAFVVVVVIVVVRHNKSRTRAPG